MKLEHNIAIALLFAATTALIAPPTHAQCPPLTQATEVDVTACGAIANDAIADDTAIQAAITLAQTLGARVIFPKGTFDLTSGLTISSSVDLVGQGADLSLLRRSAATLDVVHVQNATGVSLRGLGFQDSSPHSQRFLLAEDVDDLIIEECHFSNLGAAAVRIDNARDVRIRDNRFEEIALSALIFKNPDENDVTERIWITGNSFVRTNTDQSQGHSAIMVDFFIPSASGPQPEERFRAFQITHNHIEDTGGRGIHLAGYRSLIAFNILDQGDTIGNKDEGITFSGSQNAIYGNLITGFVAHGVLLWANDHQATGQSHRNNLIANNLIWGNGNSGVAAILSEEQGHIANLKITGNLLAETSIGQGHDQNWGVRVGDFNGPLVNVSTENVAVHNNSAFGHVNGAFDFTQQRDGIHFGSNDEDAGATKLAVDLNTISGGSFPSGQSVVNWQTPTVDDDGFFDVAQPSKLTIRETGVYAVHCSLDWQANSNGHRTAALRRNSSTIIARSRVDNAGAFVPVPVAVHTVQRFTADDQVECLAQHNSSAGTLTVQAGNLTFFRLVKVEG